jgi:hypothetical protein
MRSYLTFEEYWELEGSRQQVESHEERARRAWGVARQPVHSNEYLCGMSFAPKEDKDDKQNSV